MTSEHERPSEQDILIHLAELVGSLSQEFAAEFTDAKATLSDWSFLQRRIQVLLSSIRKEDRKRTESITTQPLAKRDREGRVSLKNQDANVLAKTLAEIAEEFILDFNDKNATVDDWSSLIYAVRDFKRFVRITDRGRSEGILPARKPRKKAAEIAENEPAPEVETDTVEIELTADTPSGSPDVVEEIREGLAEVGMELDPEAAELIQVLEDNDSVRLIFEED